MQSLKIFGKLNKKDTKRVIIYLIVFLFTLHLTPATYISSSFLEQFIGEKNIGLVYAIASILTIGAFVLIRKILKKTGNYKVFIFNLFTELVCLSVLSLSLFVEINNFWILTFVIAYIIGFIVRSGTFFNLDIFLEQISSDRDTGGIRGVYLTSLNTAFIIGPLIAGLIITNAMDAGKAYLLGSILLLPVIYLSLRYLNDFKDPRYTKSQIIETAKKVFRDRNLYRIFSANFILRFFYSWMVIYAPIFLHTNIGFSLSEVTIIIAIALIPFVILQVPLGRIADSVMGEKELLIIGFIIAGLTTASMAFIDIHSFWLWAGIMFTTRVGISAVEVMTETYLFKKINSSSIDIISFYRTIRPIAYTISPLIASIFLVYVDIKFLFLILGIIVLYGVRFSFGLKDTL